jgi:hypothetical protein
MFHPVIFYMPVLRIYFLQQLPKRWYVPLSIAQFVNEAADRIVVSDLEETKKRGIGSLNPQMRQMGQMFPTLHNNLTAGDRLMAIVSEATRLLQFGAG